MHSSKPETLKEIPNAIPTHVKGQPTVKVKTTSPPLTGKALKPNAQKVTTAPTGRSSKPIINWFQRKILAGTGRVKRAENHRAAVEANARREGRSGPRPASRIVSSPLPTAAAPNATAKPLKPDTYTGTQRKTLSLNGDGLNDLSIADDDGRSVAQSRESTWSPGSILLEADDDASVRPLPPSAPPSPSPSRSSSSYLSDPRTFKSIAASTKPTTLLSIDINGGGMAHIAQAPPTPSTAMNRFPPHIRNLSSSTSGTVPINGGGSITFSVPPASPQSLSSSPSPNVNSNNLVALQAPLHTTHHPRNNPRPSSPPLDNASVLTLASSAFAIPGPRATLARSATPSHRGIGDSVSQFGTFGDAESTSQFILNDDDRLDERDVDASVRALRPRSSRRGSWESEVSRWSAKDPLALGPASLARDRSLRTTNSIKTNPLSTDATEIGDQGSGLVGVEEGEISPRSDLRSVNSSTSSPVAEVASGVRSVDNNSVAETQSKESMPVSVVEQPKPSSKEDRKTSSDTSSRTPEPLNDPVEANARNIRVVPEGAKV